MEWGVSIASLLVRSRTLEIISEHTYRRGFTALNSKRWPDGTSWRVREPGDLGLPEQPMLLRKSVDLLEPEGVGTASLANQLQVPEDLVCHLVGGDDRRLVVLADT